MNDRGTRTLASDCAGQPQIWKSGNIWSAKENGYCLREATSIMCVYHTNTNVIYIFIVTYIIYICVKLVETHWNGSNFVHIPKWPNTSKQRNIRYGGENINESQHTRTSYTLLLLSDEVEWKQLRRCQGSSTLPLIGHVCFPCMEKIRSDLYVRSEQLIYRCIKT